MNLSIFFPAYNEESNIENTVRQALAVVRELEQVERFEMIIVDDGSTDRTGEIAGSLASEIPEVKVIYHKKNRGYGAALKTGFYESQYEWLVFTDSDGQFDFSEVGKFLERRNEGDLIIGYRIRRVDPFLRKVNALLWGLLPRLFFGLKVCDLNCGFKLIRKRVIGEIEPLESDGAFITAELLIKAKKRGFKISEVGVRHFPRTAGSQTGANIRVILKAFKDLLSLWRKLRANSPTLRVGKTKP